MTANMLCKCGFKNLLALYQWLSQMLQDTQEAKYKEYWPTRL